MLPFVIAATTVFGFGIAHNAFNFFITLFTSGGKSNDIVAHDLLHNVRDGLVCTGMLIFGGCTIYYWRF